MNLKQFKEILDSIVSNNKLFLSVNFGCRVNVAEINELSQILVDNGFKPTKDESPNIILVNTCSITKKGEIESLSRVRILNRQYPDSIILVTGCANLKKLSDLKNVYTFDNKIKEEILSENHSTYSSEIKDKFSNTNRFLLRIQSGCSQFCSYCTVPLKRQYLWSLEIDKAVLIVKKVIENGYQEIIITGVNLNQYQPGFSNLIEALLEKTEITLISFGSIPINCIDDKFIEFYKNPKYQNRLSSFLHIPIQSGSDKILKLMNRHYTQEKILNTFNKLKPIKNIQFGTDVIVGFPGETESDFQDTFNVCKNINFQKIHCFTYSVRPNTLAKTYYESQSKIDKATLKQRSQTIRNLVK